MMKLIEVEGEGLPSLLGRRVLLMCANYFYEGILEGVNDTCVKLSGPGIVYETGKWDVSNSNENYWKDKQLIPGDYWYIKQQAIESFGLSPSLIVSP